MAVTTVRPSAVAVGSGLFTVTGAGTIEGALNDSSDSSYIQKTSTIVGSAEGILDFGTTTITSAQKVKRVRLRARVSTPSDAGKINTYLGSRINNANYFYSALAIRGTNSSATTFVGPWFNSAPNGSDWSQASINGLRAKVEEYSDSTDIGKIYELFIDVDVAAQPTVTVGAPSGTITSTSAPDVTWTYADSDNETQSYYQMKVFSSAQYGAANFNATTSTATYDSGEVASSDQTSVVGALLLNGQYRAYIRVAKAINGAPFWSSYAYTAFTISYTPPTVPSMAVAWSAAFGQASFTLSGNASGSYVSQYFQVERSDDSGVTYDYIRGGSNITPSGAYVGTINDFEAPRLVTVYYRCRSVGVDSNSNEFPSGWGTVQQVLITNDESWWFKCITNSNLNKGNIRVLKQINVKVIEPNTVFRPLGSNRPIVVSGPIQGEDGGYNIKTVTEAEWDSIQPLINHQGTLLVQDPFGNQKYIRIVNREYQAETQGGNIYRDINLTYVEVAP
jgi:hypothetical protein